jgi:L-ascorbate metabolism protein UlaG (beta-lactamase superfamily)
VTLAHAFAVATAGAFLASVLPAAAAMSDDSLATSKGDVVIHPIHHAALTLTWNGKTILVDPAPPQGDTPPADPTAEYKALPPPDVILVTHDHPDHFNAEILTAVVGANATLIVPQEVADKLPQALKSRAKVIGNGETATVGDIQIEATPMYNTTPDRTQYHPKGGGNGYVLSLGGKRIYVAGDTEEAPELKSLPNIDIAFIPMNLPYTQTVEAAAQWVKDFKPKVVYPYHYQGSDVNAFARLVGNASEVRLRKWY